MRPASAAFQLVAWPATALFLLISLAPRDLLPKYRYSFVFLVPILWGVFALRRRLHLRPFAFALFAFALVLHDLGAFGWYQRPLLGLQYDWYVHFVFGLVGGSILARALSLRLGLRGATLAWMVVLLVTGIGGLHEIAEAASSIALGPDYGMLRIGPDNPYDTQEDLLNNVLGSALAVAWHLLRAGRTGTDVAPRGS